MPAFPTATELDAYTSASPQMALQVATNRLVAELGWDPRANVRQARVAGQRVVLLPALHVTQLSTAPVTASAWTEEGVVWFTTPYTGLVTYTAGWVDADLPQVLSDVILEWAASWRDNPRGLRSTSWTTGSETESQTYAIVAGQPGGSGDPRLDPYRVQVHLA